MCGVLRDENSETLSQVGSLKICARERCLLGVTGWSSFFTGGGLLRPSVCSFGRWVHIFACFGVGLRTKSAALW